MRSFFFLLLLTFAAARCRTSLDCHDGLPETLDVCLPHRHCINVLRKHSILDPTFRQNLGEETTKEELVKEANAVPIPSADRRKALSVMSIFARDFNPHRFLHLNLLRYDPVEEFTALSSREDQLSNVEFHDEVRNIFQKMNDRHSTYYRPAPLLNSFAMLNVKIAPFYVASKLRFIASEVVSSNTTFQTGVEIIRWNGVPIAQEVARLGEEGYGANEGAKLAQAIDSLVVRQLGTDEIPKEDFVKITYVALDGQENTVSLPWMYVRLPPIDLIPVRRQLQTHNDHRLQIGYLPLSVRDLPDRKSISIEEPTVASALRAEIIETSVGPIGRLEVIFFPIATPAILAEYKRVISLLPKTGLIVDLRGNMGGAPDLVKNLLEFISDVDVPDFTSNIRASPLMQNIVFQEEKDVTANETLRAFYYDLFIKPFQPALQSTLQVGETFTGPVTSFLTEAGIPRQERVYFGPFTVVIDGNTYSGGDLFSAFVVDTEAAELVGVANATGGGGASTILYRGLQKTVPKALDELVVEFSTSYSRFYRYGKKSGKLVEQFGVTPDVLYLPTYKDAVQNDCDLIEFLVDRLAGGVESPAPEESQEELL